MTGLVLTGGGARAAYQIGALKGVRDVLRERGRPLPFRIITGISAGAINAAFLAARAEDPGRAIDDCFALWRDLRPEQVIRTDTFNLVGLGLRWLRNLIFGGAAARERATHLLDTAPLRALLGERIPDGAIRRNVERGLLHGVAFSATNYRTGTAVTFFDAHPSVQEWARSTRIGRRTGLGVEHLLASASIPILFRPVSLDGAWYGDGGVRLRAPLSPAIHLGADRVLAVGIRYERPSGLTRDLNEAELDLREPGEITLADVGGVVLNSIFMDGLEGDAERMIRINQTLSLMTEDARRAHPSGLRMIGLEILRPSQDLGRLAGDQFRHFPALLRHLLRGIGASEERGWDLLSYLAFDRSYTGPLLDIGYADARARADELAAFLA